MRSKQERVRGSTTRRYREGLYQTSEMEVDNKMKVAITAKRAVILFMTMALAVAMVACQGAVGKTGETGPKGEPGDPAPPAPAANLAPQARALVLPALMLVEEGESKSVNVAANFFDTDAAEGETLTLSHSGSDASVVTVTLTSGMLTVGPVAAGDTVITVTATDAGGLSASATIAVTVAPEGMMPPMYVADSLPASVALMPGGQHTISGADIAAAFTEDEGESLTFAASGDDDSIVMVTMPAADVIITALAMTGDATVTITATDEDDLTAEHEIAVSVRATLEPTKSDMTPAAVDLLVGGVAATVDVSMYFVDPDVGDLMYEASSSDDTKATANADGSMVTITPVAATAADMPVTVTVTASNAHGSASQMISVTVAATPPTRVGSIPDVTLMSTESTSVGLAQYFAAGTGGGPITSYAASVEGNAVTARVIGDTLLIEAQMAGEATITVTATDADVETVMQTIMVTVEAEAVVEPPTPNMAPRMIAGKTLDNLRIQIVDSDADTGNDTSAADTADNKKINLSEYFEDPDGVLVFFKVIKKAGTETLTDTALQAMVKDNPVIDLHSADPDLNASPNVPASGDPPNFELNANVVILEPLRPGSVTVMVTAKDVDGASTDAEFMVTVVAAGTNVGPELGHSDAERQTDADTAAVFPDQVATAADTTDAAKRLKIGAAARKVIDDQNISTLFWDPNFLATDRSESLTLTVKYFPVSALAAIDGDAINTNTMKELEADKVAVQHSLSATTWDGTSSAKVTFTLEGVKGTDNTSTTPGDHGHLVALIATDTYGRSFAHVLRVVVNNPPKAYGAQPMEKDRTRLKDYKDFTGLVATNDAAATSLTLVADGAGYFSDADNGDTLTCENNFITSEANKAAADKLFDTVSVSSANALGFTSTGRIGSGWIRVWCSDGIDSTPENSADATVPVSYTRGASIH